MLLPIVLSMSLASDAVIPEKEAISIFDAALSLARKDNGKLWGTSLEGPILLIDPKSRQIVTSQADAEGALAKDGKVFRGQYPLSGTFGNTAVDWKGVRWTMLMWPLPGNKDELARLVMHESFHRIQPLLKWPMEGSEAPHLAEMNARILLQLEYRALAKALLSSGKEKDNHTKAALVFRFRRWGLYARAAECENGLELNEGIAEYTGMKLSGCKDSKLSQILAERLKQKEGADSYARSFCYETGPAYGLLLDSKSKTWRQEMVHAWNLTDLAAKAYGQTSRDIADVQYRQLAEQYDVRQLEQSEVKLNEERLETIRRYRDLFVDGPVIVLHLESPNISFNPSNLFPIGDEGTVYPTMVAADKWGKLEVKSVGALMKDWKTIRIALPKDTSGRTINGDGWTLELAEGWILKQGTRPHDLVAERQ